MITKSGKKFNFNDPLVFWSRGKIFIFRILNITFIILGFIFSLFLVLLHIERWNYLGIILIFFFIYTFLRQSFSDLPLKKEYLQQRRINLASFLSPTAKMAFIDARFFARRKKIDFPLALLSVLLSQPRIERALSYLNFDFQAIKKWRKKLENTEGGKGEQLFPQFVESLSSLALKEALAMKKSSIDLEALFLALLDFKEERIEMSLEEQRLQKDDYAIAFLLNRLQHQRRMRLVSGLADIKELKYQRRFRKERVNRSLTSRPTPLLDIYGTDLTELAEDLKIGIMIGHRKEYQSLLNYLSQEGKKNILLVGPPHTGKDMIISYLALNLVRDRVPRKLLDYRLVELDLSSLLENTKEPLQVANRLVEITKEVLNNENIILYLPNLSAYKLFAQEGGLSALKVLEPLFNSFSLPLLATSTLKDYHRYLENDSVIEENFDFLRIKPVSSKEAVEILAFRSLQWQRKTRVKVSYQAIKRAVMLAQRFMASIPLPSSAETLLSESLAAAKNKSQKVVRETDIVNLVGRKTDIPLQTAAGREKEKLLHLEVLIHQYLINQEEAVKLVSAAMRQYRAGLKNPQRPIATFLFVGPTGVGKTELAKTLARIYFGSKKTMIRFDMSEYQDRKSIFRFIGSPDRQISGALTEAVKANPFSLILLDEFEKAHPNVLNLFLSVFDEGRLTDNWGEVIDFTNTIIIATSNALSTFVKNELEKQIDYPTLVVKLKKRLTGVLRPELVNRFDEVVVFRPLTEDNLIKIVRLQLGEFAQMVEREKGIEISFSDGVVNELAHLGYNPIFGARPLRAVIRHFIKGSLAEAILKGNVRRRSKILFTFEKGKFNIKISKQK